MTWKNGNISGARIYSDLGGNCRIRTKIPVRVLEVPFKTAVGINPNSFYVLNAVPKIEKNNKNPLVNIPLSKEYIIDFETQKGKSYTIIPLHSLNK